MATDGRVFRIAHISDLHCGGNYFEPSLLERAIAEVNELQPDIVVCSGDLTTFGFRHEYLTAREYLDRIECESLVVVPGNHDSRNVGYVHFEEMFGSRNSVLTKGGVAIVAVDSSEPDLDHGQLGRGRYRWVEEQFAQEPAELKIFVLHHHLLPVPGTGRERNVVYDAGDAIECLQRAGVRLVLSGPQARAVRLAARRPVRRQRGDRLVAASAWKDAALLQRDRGRGPPRGHLAATSVPRPGEARHVLARHARVREVHRRHRGRGHSPHVKALALVDGEHYPPVVRDAIAELPYEIVGAVLVGGTEKLRGRAEYGVPLFEGVDGRDPGPPPGARRRSLRRARPRPGRALLGSRAPCSRPECRTSGPTSGSTPRRSQPFPGRSLAVIGTGKRVGKTAVTGYVARLAAAHASVVVVAMGRGGPAEPETITVPPTVEALVELSRGGRHAASDHLETAALVGVETIGCRRCGGGLAGAVYTSNVEEGARIAAGPRSATS